MHCKGHGRACLRVCVRVGNGVLRRERRSVCVENGVLVSGTASSRADAVGGAGRPDRADFGEERCHIYIIYIGVKDVLAWRTRAREPRRRAEAARPPWADYFLKSGRRFRRLGFLNP